MGTDTCTDSDQAGQFVLGGLPEGQDIELAFEKPGSTKFCGSSTPEPRRSSCGRLAWSRTRAHANCLARAGIVIDSNKGNLVGVPLAPGEGIGGVVLPEDVVITLKPSGPAPLYSLGSESARWPVVG